VSIVVLGGIKRISKIATKVVPVMVGLYFLLVFIIIIMNINLLPKVFYNIVSEAFNLEAGFGALAFIALTGARRAMYVNEAGVGTASLMHGASRNTEPVREGLVAMTGPAIDSGLVCTLTSIPILMAMMVSPIEVEGVKGLYIALNAFETMLPGWGEYALMVIVFIFAVTTMFSYSFYGTECAGYLFGYKNGKYYDYFYLFMIVVACVISLDLVVSIMDLAFALMTIPTMFVLLRLAPQVKREMKVYFAKGKQQ
ncbi:MAG: alanine:cation symporter family protein, partial [Muribaculaceae bacterium]|nr:alanine:cation symporter family protein [Muribaculaceae bacterium]